MPHHFCKVQAKPTKIAHFAYDVPGVLVYNTKYDYVRGTREWKKKWAEPHQADVYIPVTAWKYAEAWLKRNNLEYTVNDNTYGHPGDLPQDKEAKALLAEKGREIIAACPTIQDQWAEWASDYQCEGVGLVNTGWRNLLLNWVGGAGKTAEAIMIAETVKGPKVFVVPSGVRPGWKKEASVVSKDIIEDITGEMAFTCMPKSKGVGPAHLINYIQDCKRNGREIRIVVGHEYLSYWADIIKSVEPTVIIFDEVDVIASEEQNKVTLNVKGEAAFKKQRSEKTGRKKRGVSALELSTLDSIKVRIGLTATPFKGIPEKFWAVAHLINPYSFGSSPYHYKGRYCGGQQGEYGLVYTKATNLNELKWRTLSFMHRVTAEEAFKGLPPISYNLLAIRKEDQQGNLRFNDKYTFNQALRAAKTDPDLPIAHELREQQVAELSRKVVVQRAVEEAVGGGKCHIMVGRLIQVEKWVTAIERALAKKLNPGAPRPGIYEITGESLTPEQKYKVIDQYAADPNGGICISSYQSSGRGVDGFQCTTRGIVTVIVDVDTYEQIVYRWRRKNQKVRVNVDFCVVEGTHQDSQLRKLVKGMKLYSTIVGSESFTEKLDTLQENEVTVEEATNSLLANLF